MHSPLLYCVLHVLATRAKEQMGWIYALWIVATMTHIKAIWEWTIGKLIRNSVGKNANMLAATFRLDRSVSGGKFGGRPQPALTGAR